eukprot:TRINITY_DN632_c0_g1_i10.p1 TRINITY_DN632_c0_g1~~TRINITY_DN632_c0_g1_i10.p1  ORF type:complete len:261 (-),score=38.66 TRINITY_DN632_c0_g1_i10:5591-6373(-)
MSIKSGDLVSAVDRLMRAMCSTESLPSAATSRPYSALLDSFSVGNSQSNLMDAYLSDTIAGMQQLKSEQLSSSNLHVKLSDKMSSMTCDTDDSPRSMLSVLSHRTEKESLFDEYAQDGPHVESESETPSEPDFDAIDYTKFVCQREKKLFKTEMCLLWIEKGFCEYGSQCKFAHHREERRCLSRHPKFRTQVCRHFAETGACPFGRRCNFLHGNEPPQCSVLQQHTFPTPHLQPRTQHQQPYSPPATPKRLPIFQVLAQE